MEAKQNWQIEYGAEMYHRAITLINETLKNYPKLLEIVYPIFANSSYYCHYESILLRGITEQRDTIFRKKCLKVILLAREKEEARIAKIKNDPENLKIVRKFKKPKLGEINFKSKSYKQLLGPIDEWNIDDVTPPPLLQKIGNEKLSELVGGRNMNLELPKIPNHSINNERHIQEVFKTNKMKDL